MTVLREAVLQADILLKWGAHPRVRLWRTNAGAAWIRTTGGTGYRPIKMNPTGSTDLTGVVKLNNCINISGVASPVAAFVGIEVKRPGGVVTPEQLRWRDMLLAMGAVYVLAYTMADADAVLTPLVSGWTWTGSGWRA
jgi:hypothetical protein